MTPRMAWLLTRYNGDDPAEIVCVILPSKRVTNQAVEDLVDRLHRPYVKECGHVGPWVDDGTGGLVKRCPHGPVLYTLTRIEVYG